ncbi:MAG: DUF370 domain-containing protein [Oscillospiraceae bacterium]
MYIHLGQDIVVRTDDVVGIFDMENSTIEKSTKNYLARAQKEGRVVNVSYEMPKSFIVCKKTKSHIKNVKYKSEKLNKSLEEFYDDEIVYISQISSQTLKKRSGFIQDLSNVNL